MCILVNSGKELGKYCILKATDIHIFNCPMGRLLVFLLARSKFFVVPGRRVSDFACPGAMVTSCFKNFPLNKSQLKRTLGFHTPVVNTAKMARHDISRPVAKTLFG